jgi:beta-glucanase (GH16 family)
VPDASEAFHTYGVELTPTKITWTIDGKHYHTFEKPKGNNPDKWPFTADNELYVILNLAMGGKEGGGEIDDSQGPWQLQVRDVKFYEYTGN